MTFPHLNRRTHLYLGLFLAPWFLMYGVSSIPFAHNQFFEERDKATGIPLWTLRIDKPYSIEVPASGELRATGARIMADLGLSDSFGAYRQGDNQVNVYVHTFRHSTQVKYFIAEQRVTVEDRRFRFDHFLTGMHARGGFEQDDWLVDLWSVVVDLACLGMLLWVLSGLYMWWHLPQVRAWGWLAATAGVASYALFMLKL